MDPLPSEAAPAATAKPARRWHKGAALAAAGVFLVVGVGLSALWWWAGTRGSLATALNWIGQSQPIVAQGATGSLRSGGQIEQLVWAQGGLRVDAREVTLSWQPWSLLQGTLKLQRIAAASVAVDDQRPPRTVPASAPTVLGLPIPISLDVFSVGQLQWNGATAFAASDLSGRYAFTGQQHQLDLLGAQVASGRYSGQAVVASSRPFVLDARLAGALTAVLPGSNTPLPLVFQATANGPLTEFQVQADLKMAETPPEGQKPGPTQPQASATARVTPWAAQPLPQADARFSDLDLAALWPSAPQTQLTGSASVRPMAITAPAAGPGWLLQLDLVNQLPGPWDLQRLPLERLESQGEWRGGAGMVRTLKARLGGGELLASGDWTPAPVIPPAPPATPGTPTASPAASAPAWTLQATLKQVNPALLHSQFAALPLDGVAAVRSQGAAIGFDASVQAAPGAAPKSLGRLALRDAKATGSWNPEQAGGGTLVLSTLRARTDDAELAGELEVQPSAKAGQGHLALTAPGLSATVKGELRQARGAGTLSLRGQDAAQALRWLQKLPGLPASLQTASAVGSADLQASWQGGWQDPALQARLAVPSLDWRNPSAKPGAVTASGTTPAQPPAGLLKVRDLSATLAGRLSQAQLGAQGRLEIDQRRIDLQLALDGGRVKPAGAGQTAFSASAWKGVLKQLSVRLEDPALGTGAWQLASRSAVPLSWAPTPAGGAFESGAGQAILSAPRATASSPAPAQATLAWQPVRWRPGELLTAGSITGLPMAWVELLGGAQLAGAGLGGNLLLDGQWDARLGDRLALKASLSRSSGDLTVQADTAQGPTTRVAAGVRQARLSLELSLIHI